MGTWDIVCPALFYVDRNGMYMFVIAIVQYIGTVISFK